MLYVVLLQMADMGLRRSLKASSFSQWLFLGLALAILGGVLSWSLYSEYHAIDANQRERLAHQAKVIDENLSYQLIATNLALDSIRGDLPALIAQKKRCGADQSSLAGNERCHAGGAYPAHP